MPKRGGRQQPNGSDFNEPSQVNREQCKDRSTVRRVSFKNTQNYQNKELKGRLAELAIRSRLEDDEDMVDLTAPLIRFDAGSRRNGLPIAKRKFGNLRKLISNPFGWYQVTVQNGQRYLKEDLIRALAWVLSPEIFIPHYWRTKHKCVGFFVHDLVIAQRLQQIERGAIQMPDGQRIFIRIRSNCPIVPVDRVFKETMKLAMSDRYNPHTKTLDISRFHADPKFKNIFVGLFRLPVMSAVLNIIVENIPDLVALYMNDNGLVGLDGFWNIPQRLLHLKRVHLANNRIPTLSHLLALRNVDIVELVLEGNPLRQCYKYKALYVSETRRKFPKLQKLDGELLEPRFHFEVSNHYLFAEPMATYLCNPSAAGVIGEFLETYFKFFDSDNRSTLLAAYHPEAMMSITVSPAQQVGRTEKYRNYHRKIRRRLERFNTMENVIKYRVLKIGNLPIVALLMELPKTQHDLLSFSIDLTVFVPGEMMVFTVTGLFKELDSVASNGSAKICYFQREFVVVPNGPGSCYIRNELFFVTSATKVQARSFMRHGNPSVSNQPGTSGNAASAAGGSLRNRLQMQQSGPPTIQIPPEMLQQTVALPNPAVPTAPVQPDETIKIRMIQAFSAQTTMNLEWSKKCLEEINWDYDQAAFVFDKLLKECKIPAEAFVKQKSSTRLMANY